MGCAEDVAIMAAVVLTFQAVEAVFGLGVALLVEIAAFIACIWFLWHVGKDAA
jgi:hypothetical protein